MRFNNLFWCKKQTPAEGIRIDYKCDTEVFYTVSCNCGNTDDQIEYSIEFDTDTKDILLHSYVKLKTDWYSKVFDEYKFIDNYWLFAINYQLMSLINGLIRRITFTWKMWVHGYVEFHTHTILNEQVSMNYAMSILDAVREMKKVNK